MARPLKTVTTINDICNEEGKKVALFWERAVQTGCVKSRQILNSLLTSFMDGHLPFGPSEWRRAVALHQARRRRRRHRRRL